MMNIGIDVSKNKLDVLWLKDPVTLKVKSKVFHNTPKGFAELCAWVKQHTKTELSQIRFIMEATGIYHEALAYALYEQQAQVAVMNPAWVRDYAKSLGIKTKNDKKDAFILARYGASQQVALWQPEAKEIRTLKSLLARLDAIEKDIQRENNRLEQATISQSSQEVIDSIRIVIKQLTKEQQRLNKIIDQHLDNHPDLNKDKELLQSIPGVGESTARCMLALYHSRPFTKATQMAAFVGLVPVEYESGSSVHKRPRLSKAGNARIRAKLYMPAVVAARWNPQAKALYKRLVEKKKSKMLAIGAVMRKLVHMCFGVLKHQQAYSSQAT